MHPRKVRTQSYFYPTIGGVILSGYNIGLGGCTIFLAWYYTTDGGHIEKVLAGLIIVSVLFAVVFLMGFHDVCLAFFWEEGLFSLYWFMDKLIWCTKKWAVCRPRFRESVCAYNCRTSQATLCDKCGEMVTKSRVLLGTPTLFARSAERHLHNPKADIEESATHCTLCKILWDSMNENHHDERDDGSQNRLRDPEVAVVIEQTRLWMVPFSMYLELSLQVTVGNMKGEVVPITIEKLNHLCDEKMTTKSETTSEYAKDWVTACNGHRICKGGDSSTTFTPTRLLSVHLPEKLIIVHGSSLLQGTDRRYVALSHCWGPQNDNETDVRTFDNNIDERHTSGIAVDMLPRNFRDAVDITRSLGIGYLWIDSLCIIQDSAEDWKTEAATMGLVYSQAACTISATASADTTGGCYYERRPKFAPSGISILRKGKNGMCLVVKSSISSRQDDLDDMFLQKVEMAPVSTRGWCFQERILARCVLHYCDGSVLFECNTLRASEAHTEGLIYREKLDILADGTARDRRELDDLLVEDEAFVVQSQRVQVWRQVGPSNVVPGGYEMQLVTSPNNAYRSLEQKQRIFLESAALNGLRGQFQMLVMAQARETERGGATFPQKIAFHKAWYEVVEEFSKRELSFYKDRFKAIQGVGSRVQEAALRTSDSMSGNFTAGLWEKNMFLDLLWKRVRGAEWGKDVNSDVAHRVTSLPTWSWTSSPVHVETSLKDFSTESIELLSSQTSLPTATNDTDGYRLHWLCQASEITDLGDGFTADKPSFDITKHRKLLWIRVAACAGDPTSGKPPTVHGIVIRCKDESQNIYKRVGYMWQEMPDVEIFRDIQPQDIIII